MKYTIGKWSYTNTLY